MELDEKGTVTGGHLAAFLADAEARGVSATQRHMLAQRIRDVLRQARATWVRDLSAAYSKHRRQDVQPLRADRAADGNLS